MKLSVADKTGNVTRLSVALLGFVLISTFILAPVAAKADGGVVRARETQGSFIVTIFTPGQIARDLPVDVTVLVQRRESGEVVMDAAVDLDFTPPIGTTLGPNDVLCGPTNTMPLPGITAATASPAFIPATRAQAANKLFYGTTVVLRAAGDWRVRAAIRQGGERASVTCVLPASPPPRRLAGLWPYLALPPFIIFLFALNQHARRLRNARP